MKIPDFCFSSLRRASLREACKAGVAPQPSRAGPEGEHSPLIAASTQAFGLRAEAKISSSSFAPLALHFGAQP